MSDLSERSATGPAIAIIAMAGRFPGATTPEALWENLLAGKQAIRRFAPEELEVSAEIAGQPGYVPARSVLDDVDLFYRVHKGLAQVAAAYRGHAGPRPRGRRHQVADRLRILAQGGAGRGIEFERLGAALCLAYPLWGIAQCAAPRQAFAVEQRGSTVGAR